MSQNTPSVLHGTYCFLLIYTFTVSKTFRYVIQLNIETTTKEINNTEEFTSTYGFYDTIGKLISNIINPTKGSEIVPLTPESGRLNKTFISTKNTNKQHVTTVYI